MEPLFWAVLAAVLFSAGVELVLELVQLRRFHSAWPKAPQLSFVDDDTFRRSQAYQLEKHRFGLACSLFDTALNLGFLMAGGLPLVWGWAGDLLLWAGLAEKPAELSEHEIKQSIVFCALVFLANFVISLPQGYYSTFVVEQRHGFNRSTRGLWLRDRATVLMLAALLGPPILAGFLWCLQVGGRWLPFLVCAFLLVINLLAVVIYPLFILPLFNKAVPVPPGRMREEVEKLARQVDFPLTKLFQIDGSKRSSHSNAYFFGWGKDKRIVLYDTLIQQSSIAEIVAVLGHELAHWQKSHTLKGLALGQFAALMQFSLFGLFVNYQPMYHAFGFEAAYPRIIGLTLFTMCLAPLDQVLALLFNWFSRRWEFQADRFAAVDLRMGAALKLGLVRLQDKNLGILDAHPWYSARHFSHPPIVERLAAIGGPVPTREDMEVADRQREREQREQQALDGAATQGGEQPLEQPQEQPQRSEPDAAASKKSE